jgi:ParB family transcriptional regulator, chromosome partitioning protein
MDSKKLKEIDIDSIDPNPENPRIFFRQEEMDSLLVSIGKIGVQVPISVYIKGTRFILIDGERRLRTCKKLNFKKIPAIIQDKPNPLQNILLMFNIHALREQWDYFTIADKLPRIIELFKKENKREPNEIELSNETGLSRGTIRRCNLIISLPQRFKTIIKDELAKPKLKQIFTADFFLEMEQSLRTVSRNFPVYEEKLDEIRDVLIKKYRSKVFDNITDFRLIQKIATSPKNLEYSKQQAQSALNKIFSDNNVDIEDVFNDSFSVLYNERKLIQLAENFKYYLENLKDDNERDEQLISTLRELKNIIDDILEEN